MLEVGGDARAEAAGRGLLDRALGRADDDPELVALQSSDLLRSDLITSAFRHTTWRH
eukprot:SAG11_NODE_2137_length_3766_cov_2.253613_4_plen_57_part_00